VAEATGWTGHGPPTLWTAPVSGPPTFDSQYRPRQSVKDTHNYSFTSMDTSQMASLAFRYSKTQFQPGLPGPLGRGILPRHSPPPSRPLVRDWLDYIQMLPLPMSICYQKVTRKLLSWNLRLTARNSIECRPMPSVRSYRCNHYGTRGTRPLQFWSIWRPSVF